MQCPNTSTCIMSPIQIWCSVYLVCPIYGCLLVRNHSFCSCAMSPFWLSGLIYIAKKKPWKKTKKHKCMFLNLNFFLNQFNESLYMHCITRFWLKKAQEWKFSLRVIWYCQRLACYIMIVTEMSICSIIRWLWCLAGVFLCGFISAV